MGLQVWEKKGRMGKTKLFTKDTRYVGDYINDMISTISVTKKDELWFLYEHADWNEKRAGAVWGPFDWAGKNVVYNAADGWYSNDSVSSVSVVKIPPEVDDVVAFREALVNDAQEEGVNVVTPQEITSGEEPPQKKKESSKDAGEKINDALHKFAEDYVETYRAGEAIASDALDVPGDLLNDGLDVISDIKDTAMDEFWDSPIGKFSKGFLISAAVIGGILVVGGISLIIYLVLHAKGYEEKAVEFYQEGGLVGTQIDRFGANAGQLRGAVTNILPRQRERELLLENATLTKEVQAEQVRGMLQPIEQTAEVIEAHKEGVKTGAELGFRGAAAYLTSGTSEIAHGIAGSARGVVQNISEMVAGDKSDKTFKRKLAEATAIAGTGKLVEEGMDLGFEQIKRKIETDAKTEDIINDELRYTPAQLSTDKSIDIKRADGEPLGSIIATDQVMVDGKMPESALKRFFKKAKEEGE